MGYGPSPWAGVRGEARAMGPRLGRGGNPGPEPRPPPRTSPRLAAPTWGLAQGVQGSWPGPWPPVAMYFLKKHRCYVQNAYIYVKTCSKVLNKSKIRFLIL